jgi:shikimate kinase
MQETPSTVGSQIRSENSGHGDERKNASRANFILIGIPGCGKTALGQRAARELGMRFYDTDALTREKMRAANLPPYLHMTEFLAYLRLVVEETAQCAENAVIATGAEVVLAPENFRILRPTGAFIYIKRDPRTVVAEMTQNCAGLYPVSSDGPQTALNVCNTAAAVYHKEGVSTYEAIADFTMENYGDEDSGVRILVELIRNERNAVDINRSAQADDHE